MPSADIKAEIVLTQINNVCPFPHTALFIFSPYTEPNSCRKNFLSPSGILPTDDQAKKHLIYFNLVISLKNSNKFRLIGICSTISLQIEAFGEDDHKAYKILYLL